MLANLATLDDKQGRWAESEQLYRRALAIDHAALGADSGYVAADMYALGLLQDRLGHASEAERLLKQALAIRKKLALFDSGNVALSLGVLARFYDGQGRNADALAAGRKAVAISSLNGPNARLRREFTRFIELGRAEPARVTELQQLLAADEAFASLTLGEKDSYLFVIRKDKVNFFKLNLTRTDALSDVKSLRASLIDDASFPSDKADTLYRKLFGPADAMISDGTSSSFPMAHWKACRLRF